MAPLPSPYRIRPGIELGFLNGEPLVYDGTEPVAIDAQAGKGKLARFLGVNLVSPRTAHLSKIITDPKNGELTWISWKTLERQGYRLRFINADQLHGWSQPSRRRSTGSNGRNSSCVKSYRREGPTTTPTRSCSNSPWHSYQALGNFGNLGNST